MQNTAQNAGLTVSFSPAPSLSLSLRLSRAFQLVAAVVSCIVVVSVCVGVWVCAAAWLCGCAFPQSSHFHPPRWPQFGAVFGRLWTRVPCPSSSPSPPCDPLYQTIRNLGPADVPTIISPSEIEQPASATQKIKNITSAAGLILFFVFQFDLGFREVFDVI